MGHVPVRVAPGIAGGGAPHRKREQNRGIFAGREKKRERDTSRIEQDHQKGAKVFLGGVSIQ